MESPLMKSHAEQRRAEEQRFLTQRITNEQIIQRWLNGCRGLPVEVKASLPIDISTATPQSLLSECYKEDMNQEEAMKQINYVNSVIEQVNQYILSLNEKALSLNNQMNNMMQGGTNGNSGI